MLINSVVIDNFRNFSNFSVNLGRQISFFIGDNGIGKSNLIDLLNIIFNNSSFSENDFADIEKRISIEISIYLEDKEIGYFDEFFDPADEHTINIIAYQEKINSRIEFKHKDTDSTIPYSKIRNIPFVYYNSVLSPTELNFNKTKTSGKFLNSIIEEYIKTNNMDSTSIIQDGALDGILGNINQLIEKLDLLNQYDVKAKFDDNVLMLIPKLINLEDTNNISINSMGSGIKYIAYIFFEILNTILKNKDYIAMDNEGKRYLSIIIALDEPEIHLHPYMQRNLINNIQSLLQNKDEDFLKLLDNIFGLDYILGQAVVATHSPFILTDNYKDYTRLFICPSCNRLTAISGNQMIITDSEYKHLLLHLSDIKECFFSKVVLTYEGDSEIGSIKGFSGKLGVDLDKLHIGLISAGGKGNITYLQKVLNHFGIKCIGVKDRDDDTVSIDTDTLFYTIGRDFETDLVNKIIDGATDLEALNEVLNIIRQYENKELNRIIFQPSQLAKHNRYLGISFDNTHNYSLNDILTTGDSEFKKLLLISWLYNDKSITRGKVFGELLSVNNIIDTHKKSILKAKEYAENV